MTTAHSIIDFRLLTNFVLAFALGALVGSVFIQDIGAAPPTSRFDTMTRQSASTLSSHKINFTLTASNTFAATETITVDFDEDGGAFTVDGASSAIADFGFNDGTERTIVGVDGDCTGHSGANDVAVGINDTTGVVTFEACGSFSASSSGATVDVEYGTAAGGTNRVTNPSAGATFITLAGTYGDDSADVAIDIVSDDQVVVSATVDETMNFAVSDNTIGFGTLNSGAARYATGDTNGSASETESHTITVGTNASSGFAFTVNGATLTSGGDTITAIGGTEATSSVGTEQFGLRANVSGGSGTVSSPYATTSQFALDTGAFPDEVGSSLSGSDDSTYSMRYLANIASSTEAGSYTSTLTYIATGTF